MHHVRRGRIRFSRHKRTTALPRQPCWDPTGRQVEILVGREEVRDAIAAASAGTDHATHAASPDTTAATAGVGAGSVSGTAAGTSTIDACAGAYAAHSASQFLHLPLLLGCTVRLRGHRRRALGGEVDAVDVM